MIMNNLGLIFLRWFLSSSMLYHSLAANNLYSLLFPKIGGSGASYKTVRIFEKYDLRKQWAT